MSIVDSLVAVIGKPRRIVGADYSDESWGVVPQAAPQAVFEGVHLHGLEEVTRQLLGAERAARPSRVETPQPKAERREASVTVLRPAPRPAPELPPAPMEEEIDWELALEAAKARASASPPPPAADDEAEEPDWEAALAAARARVA